MARAPHLPTLHTLISQLHSTEQSPRTRGGCRAAPRSPRCGRRTRSSSSRRTCRPSGWWRRRCRSCAPSCCPRPPRAPRPPRRAAAGGSRCRWGTCALCRRGPWGEGQRGEGEPRGSESPGARCRSTPRPHSTIRRVYKPHPLHPPRVLSVLPSQAQAAQRGLEEQASRTSGPWASSSRGPLPNPSGITDKIPGGHQQAGQAAPLCLLSGGGASQQCLLHHSTTGQPPRGDTRGENHLNPLKPGVCGNRTGP